MPRVTNSPFFLDFSVYKVVGLLLDLAFFSNNSLFFFFRGLSLFGTGWFFLIFATFPLPRQALLYSLRQSSLPSDQGHFFFRASFKRRPVFSDISGLGGFFPFSGAFFFFFRGSPPLFAFQLIS